MIVASASGVDVTLTFTTSTDAWHVETKQLEHDTKAWRCTDGRRMRRWQDADGNE